MKERFTIDGSEELEHRLARICDRVLTGLRQAVPDDKLEAVYLGGGYGRGEGGVLQTENGQAPYNDLEFWVFLRGHPFINERMYKDSFHHVSEKLSEEAGIEVEFKIASAKKLARVPPTMFAYDLAMGHRRIFGHGGLLSDQHLHDGGKIPLYEATRLLMNRCTGLLLARERLQRGAFTSDDADFVGRNQAKAQLGLGDVFLAALGQYHWSCRERNERLKKLCAQTSRDRNDALKWPFSISKICCHHTEGVDFKLHPQKKSGAARAFEPLQNELTDLGRRLWLWLEGKRLRQTFASARDYALDRIDKCPETNPAHNRLVNFKTFGPSILLTGEAKRYPRERLFNCLALLLWEPTALEHSFLLEKIQSELKTGATSFSDVVAAYQSLWRNFN